MDSNDQKHPHIAPFIRELYPDASQQELEEAHFNLTEYLKVVIALFEELGTSNGGDSAKSEPHSRFKSTNANDV